MHSDGQWQLDENADMAWRQWDGEYVVHHALSNDTFRLSELAGRVLLALRASPAPCSVAALAVACGMAPDETEETLENLEAVGLVHPCRA